MTFKVTCHCTGGACLLTICIAAAVSYRQGEQRLRRYAPAARLPMAGHHGQTQTSRAPNRIRFCCQAALRHQPKPWMQKPTLLVGSLRRRPSWRPWEPLHILSSGGMFAISEVE